MKTNRSHNHLKPIVTILLWISLGIYISFSLYAYFNPETKLFQILFTNHFHVSLDYIPLWIYFFIHLTLFSIIGFMLFFVLSAYHTVQRNKQEKLVDRYYKFFTYALSLYFIDNSFKSEEKREVFFQRISRFLRKRTQLISFLESYLRIQELVAQNLSDDFKHLIEKLELQKKIEFFLYSRNFDDVILSLKVLSYLRLKTNVEQIKLLAKNKNFVVRAEAYASLIRLMDDDKYFVDFIEEEHAVSVLNINTIVNAVLKNQKDHVDYQSLLTSENERMVMIGMVLLRYLHLEQSIDLAIIRNHLGSTNLMLNILAWNTLLIKASEKEAVDLIIERFEQEPDPVKLKIIENSYHISDPRFYDFLVKIMNHQPLLVKVDAMKIIFKNTPDKLSKFASVEEGELKIAYDETVCIYIN